MNETPRSWGIRVFQRLPGASAIAVGTTGVIALVGWAQGGRTWRALSGATFVLIPNTALLLVAASTSLWLGRRREASRWLLFISRILGAAVAIAGGLFLYETLSGRDLGIDLRLLGTAVRNQGWTAPGRPAPNASFDFALVGAALAALDIELPRRRRPAQWAATVALLVAFTALVGYVNGVARLYEIVPRTGMAFVTAMAFAVLSMGVLFARRTSGLAAILVDDAAGGVLARRLLPAAVLVPIALGWFWLWGQSAGFWDRTDGPSIFVVASSVALVWLVVRSALVVHATDVQRSQLLVREQDARREAETANRTKGDFLAVMSHELRTPLSAIIGYQELLADGITGPVTESQRQQLNRIKVSARHLLQLIDEILTYSRAEAGKEEVRYEWAGVNAMVDEAAALVEPLATDKGVAFAVTRIDPPLTIRTDPRKVRQILVNLLSNAVKFTDAGGTVSLRALRNEDRLELLIGDTGIGIRLEHIDLIFDPFWQVEQKATRRAGGTGLGLSVSRRLARLLGGDISVRSDIGRGSVFTVTLPAPAPTVALPRPRGVSGPLSTDQSPAHRAPSPPAGVGAVKA